MRPGNTLILESKGQRSRLRGTQKHCRRGSRRCYECWILLVVDVAMDGVDIVRWRLNEPRCGSLRDRAVERIVDGV